MCSYVDKSCTVQTAVLGGSFVVVRARRIFWTDPHMGGEIFFLLFCPHSRTDQREGGPRARARARATGATIKGLENIHLLFAAANKLRLKCASRGRLNLHCATTVPLPIVRA